MLFVTVFWPRLQHGRFPRPGIERTPAAAVAQATAVTMPDPLPTWPPLNSLSYSIYVDMIYTYTDDLLVTSVLIYPLFICSWVFPITMETFGIFQSFIFKYFPLNFS